MKPGAENRKKTIAAGALVTVALLCIIYAYNALFAGSSPAPAPTPAPANASPARTAASTPAPAPRSTPANPNRAVPGVAAAKIATTSASLDPTLDESAMLRTESLVYAGSGRNIFSAVYTPPTPVIPKQIIPPRPTTPPLPQAPVYTGPPPPPPINLKFFGTATRANGLRQAFLLQGEDVYLASQGDIVARKYKIGNITLNNVQVTDLQNNNTQTLPLMQ